MNKFAGPKFVFPPNAKPLGYTVTIIDYTLAEKAEVTVEREYECHFNAEDDK